MAKKFKQNKKSKEKQAPIYKKKDKNNHGWKQIYQHLTL
jgi:hypothetical protein